MKFKALSILVFIGFVQDGLSANVPRHLPRSLSCQVTLERTRTQAGRPDPLSYEVNKTRIVKNIYQPMEKLGYVLFDPIKAGEVVWSVERTLPSSETHRELIEALSNIFKLSVSANPQSESLHLRITRGPVATPIAKASTYARLNRDTNINLDLETSFETKDAQDNKVIITKASVTLSCMSN